MSGSQDAIALHGVRSIRPTSGLSMGSAYNTLCHKCKNFSIEKRTRLRKKKSTHREKNIYSPFFNLNNFSISQGDFTTRRFHCITGIVGGAPRTKLRLWYDRWIRAITVNGIIKWGGYARMQMLSSRILVSGVLPNGNHPNCSNFVRVEKYVYNSGYLNTHWRNATSEYHISNIICKVIHIFLFLNLLKSLSQAEVKTVSVFALKWT